jgi:hypothetical protein
MSPASRDLVACIDERLAEARAEIASLEAAVAAFNRPVKTVRDRRPACRQAAAAAPTSAAAPRPRPTRSSPTGSHASPRRTGTARPAGDVDVDAPGLQALLGDSDGLTTTALAHHTGAHRTRILAVLRRLETDGQIRRSGVRRGTRWHLITDEDRIALRAAELARQSRAANVITSRPARRAARRS